MTAAARALGALLVALPASHAQAAQAEEGWASGNVVLRASVAAIRFNESAEVQFGTTPVPGASVVVSNSTTAALEAEVFVKPQISLALTAGLPPTTKLTGTGAIASVGQLGTVKYGTVMAMARFHLHPSGRLSPFAGLGITHFFPVRTSNGSVGGLKVSSNTAVALQGGFDLRVIRRIGLFASLTWTPLRTEARGAIGPIPVGAKLRLNPLVVQAGISFRL